jgi:hypothetical protein
VTLAPESTGQVLARTIDCWIERRWRRYVLPFVLVVPERWRWKEPSPGPARLPNVDAAIMLCQLRSLDRRVRQRRANAEAMLASLTEIAGTRIGRLDGAAAVAKLVFVLPGEGPTVNEMIAALASIGVEAQRGYVPLHQGLQPGLSLPVTDELWQRVLCVPVETSVVGGWFGSPRRLAQMDLGQTRRRVGNGIGLTPRPGAVTVDS